MNKATTPAVLVCILGFAGLCLAMVTITNNGTWPDTWPKELEQYRAQAKTHGVAHGISENVHEISFAKRDEFEKAWPHILKLRSSGTRLVLQTSPSIYSVSGSEMGPGVRILVAETIITGAANPEAQPKEEEDPLTGTELQELVRQGKMLKTELQELVKQGKMLKTGPPWPKYIMIDDELPEYVQAKYVDGKQKWEPVDAGIRARLDIELVVDGSIVDLNRIQLPPNTLIIDNRFNKE